MITATVQIGNSDNKLTQAEWSDFVRETGEIIRFFESRRHFFGGPNSWEAWQNAAWVFDVPSECARSLSVVLEDVAKKFRQESIALTLGWTQFVKGGAS